MIENVNASKEASTEAFVEIKKYIGVASINVLAVNPGNAILRKFGWAIPEDAEEPTYYRDIEVDGKTIRRQQVCLLVQIQDLEDKPVIRMNFTIGKEARTNKEGTKCQIIDQFGRTAWATKEEFQAKKIPVYSNGQPANISSPYRICHYGEGELVTFLFKYLNITPMRIFDRQQNLWIPTKNPGKLMFDNWEALCMGNMTEFTSYLALQPDNKVKVVLGVHQTENNRSYQTFLKDGYIGNGARADFNTGEFAQARKLIDKLAERGQAQDSYMATPVKEWKTEATQVEEPKTMFDSEGNFQLNDDDDLPFGD